MPEEGRSDLTLDKQILQEVLSAWPLLDMLEMNFDNDVDGSLDFFTAESEFYPDFDRLCRQRVIEHFPEAEEEDEED
ncbi:MAG: hypothetical protein LC118_08150 [Dehalococcoidia bacterium]|nr:hypothetical protein [Dehalococcoidia bacterium]